jgi:tetratricopeptide (TPR) repeat protein
MTLRAGLVVMVLALTAGGCASVPRSSGPAYPDFVAPEIPARAALAADLRQTHTQAWQRLQAGDLRGANTAYAAILQKQPSFYPAETGLGLVALANKQYRPAADRFTAALARDAKYVPALRGLVSAELGLDDVDAAVGALERLIALDPSNEADRTRLDLLRVRQVQQLTDTARRARGQGRHAEAAAAFSRALEVSSSSPTLLRELALEELAIGRISEAEGRVRKALQLDAADAETHAALGTILEARGRLTEAGAAYRRAAEIDSKWRAKADASRAAAARSGLPDELRELASAPSVTRGQLAALVAVRLGAVLDRAPKRPPSVATDIRTHWAAASIMRVTQAGVMDVAANHTFRPDALVSRGDLASVSARLVPLALGDRSAALAPLKAARPVLGDISESHALYRSAALAVASEAMKTDEGGRFQPAKAATGSDVLAAVARLHQLGEPRGATTR